MAVAGLPVPDTTDHCPLSAHKAQQPDTTPDAVKWAHLDQETYLAEHTRLTSGAGRRVKTTILLPTMHCASCVGFLEKLPGKLPGIAEAIVDLPRKQLKVVVDLEVMPLSQLAGHLTKLGYPPDFQADATTANRKEMRAIVGRLAVAGFGFGNIMLLALADYVEAASFAGTEFEVAFGWIALVLATPVMVYSGSSYWVSAWKALKDKRLNIDVPVAIGMATIFVRSAMDVFAGHGMGYFDSLAGLVFFLLIGKWYQNRTYNSHTHERTYESWFPVSVVRLTAAGPETVRIRHLQRGDRIRIHNGEILPADGEIIRGAGALDRSFITGESDPIPAKASSVVEAGSRWTGAAMEMRVETPVATSKLTRLWNAEAFDKSDAMSIADPVNRISSIFTPAILAVAVVAAGVHLALGTGLAWDAFTAALIVACPCALALSIPFTYGSALRWLGRAGAFLKNVMVVEKLARLDALVFDKTGTLTHSAGQTTTPHTHLSPTQERLIASVAHSSSHPLSRGIVRHLMATRGWTDADLLPVEAFFERPGQGIEATVQGHNVLIGSRRLINAPRAKAAQAPGATEVHASIDGVHLGHYALQKPMRDGVDEELKRLRTHHELYLLSGDSDAEAATFAPLFRSEAMRFAQTPEDKMAFIESLQSDGKRVAMIGDGLNDAGALKQANLGVALVDDLYAFSPASDMILHASGLQALGPMLRFARDAQKTVYLLFVVSLIYNVIGLGFAVQGLLTPVVAAILMPISSMTVVGVALVRTGWAWRKAGLAQHHFAN